MGPGEARGGGAGWNWLELAGAGCGRTGLPSVKSESADRVRFPLGLRWPRVPSGAQRGAGPGAGTGVPSRPCAGLQPRALWAARVSPDGAGSTGRVIRDGCDSVCGACAGERLWSVGSPVPPLFRGNRPFVSFLTCLGGRVSNPGPWSPKLAFPETGGKSLHFQVSPPIPKASFPPEAQHHDPLFILRGAFQTDSIFCLFY